MAPSPFRFKQFSVSDDLCTHKVGTDGVLLGSWVHVEATDHRLLDIGTGSGLIALMLAQRSHKDATIDAIEISARDAGQATMNARHSPWSEKITVIQAAFQEFSPGVNYDLIVSNPPYFVGSLLPHHPGRMQARHADSLPFGDLLVGIDRMLAERGRFCVVLPFTEGQNMIQLARVHDLFPSRICAFRSRRNKPPERLLIELSRGQKTPEETEIVLYDGNEWSEPYKRLTQAFYLKI